MSEQNGQVPVVNRNKVDLPFTELEITGARSANRGKKYFAPQFSEDDNSPTSLLKVGLPWLGVKDTVDLLNGVIKPIFISLMVENTSEDGEFDSEQWTKDAIDFMAGQITLSEQRDAIMDLQKENGDLVDNGKNDGNDMVSCTDPTKLKAITERVKANSAKLRQMNAKLAADEAKATERAQQRAASKAANKAAAEAAAKQTKPVAEAVPA